MALRKKAIMFDHAKICIFSVCKIKGHTIDKCQKKDTSNSSVKVDSAKGATGSNDDTYTFKDVSCNKHSNYPGLLVNTGDTSHIVRDKDMFIKSMMTSGPRNMLLSLVMAQNSMQPRTEEPPVLASRMQVVGCFQLNPRTLCTYQVTLQIFSM